MNYYNIDYYIPIFNLVFICICRSLTIQVWVFYLIVGISSLDTVERYDPDLDEWKNIARMNKNRSAAGVVHLDGKIYALGGHNGLSIFESVEFYDTRTGGWEGKYDLDY